MSKNNKENRKPFILKIVLDTSVLFTPSTNVINHELSKLLKESSTIVDLVLEWYVPEVVMHERKYQLINLANVLLSTIKKLDKILELPDFSSVDVESQVSSLITDTLKSHYIRVLPLDTDKVNWDELIKNAAYRKPPFKPGEQEKGFRDAIVIETYMQLLTISNEDPNLCQVVLAVNDKLLATATQDRIKEIKNAHPPCIIDETRGLINALVSEKSERSIQSIQKIAESYFFTTETEDGLFFRETLRARIEAKFSKELMEIPEGADRRVNDAWIVSSPQFLKEVQGRFTWISKISLEHSAYKTDYKVIAFSSGSYFGGSTSGSITMGTVSSTAHNWGTTPMFTTGSLIESIPGSVSPYPGQCKEREVYNKSFPILPTTCEANMTNGDTIFEVEWSVLVNDNNQFTGPIIEEIRLIHTQWY